MSNWFQDHPVFTIIGHTIIVATATWLVSSFVIDENKVNFYRAKAESSDSISAQYKAKISILELELGKLKVENERYLSWLAEEPKTLPAMERKIKTLEESLVSLKAAADLRPSVEGNATPTKNDVYEFSMPFSKGESFVDPKTKAVIGISDIAADYTAKGTLYLPGAKPVDLKDVKPGTTWMFEKNGVSYQMTLEKLNWLNNSVKASVTELATDTNKDQLPR
jgi:hypothetical protein